jgi:hypothetical protein
VCETYIGKPFGTLMPGSIGGFFGIKVGAAEAYRKKKNNLKASYTGGEQTDDWHRSSDIY